MLARSLDQFFTKPAVAVQCLKALNDYMPSAADDWLWIEPSAGGGVFYDLMPYPKIGLDIMSQRPDITQTDFLGWHPGQVRRKIAVVGNPPFGKNSSLARRFFDHWQDSLKWQRLKPFEKFAAMVDAHWDGIASYCHVENKVSLGFVEGLNNKIRVIQRRAYGYRDEEYFRLKIPTCMLDKL